MSKRLIVCIIIFSLLFTNLSYNAYALGGGGGGNSNKAKIEYLDDGLQYLIFKVSSTTSNAKYRYKTIGWDITFTPNGESPMKTTIAYNFDDYSGSNDVKIKLEEVFDGISTTQEEKDKLKKKDGILIADAVQIILINDIPMDIHKKPISNWNNDFKSLLTNNSMNVQLFTDDANGILKGLPYGLEWSPNTQDDLKNYYNQEAPYDKLYTEIDVGLDIEVMSTIDDHTLDMSKGEGSAQVRIHANANVKGFKTNEPNMEDYLNNPSNIRQMVFTVDDGKTTKIKTITSFSSISGTADFTFDYNPNDIEDGDSDLDDTVRKTYRCNVKVDYNNQLHGYAIDNAENDLIKKAPIPDGDPLAILSVPDQVLVDEEILADGSGSIAPKGATLVNYSWEVESESLPKEEGNKSIKLTYDEPKTVTVALTVEDSNGKTDTVMKNVKVIKKASPPINWSPDVTLSAPSIVMQGDSFSLYVNAMDQEDGPLTPTLSKPSSLVLSGSVHNGDNTAKFIESGIFTVTAKATDSGGKSDSASIQIEVCPPKPLAIISEDGDYKVGQTVVLDSSNSKAVSKTYPIDWTLTNWTITPLGSLTSDDIYTKKLNSKEIAFTSKKSGKVEIALTVTNTLGYSNTRTIERTILADTPPIADFTLIEKVYRDKDNDKKATVKAFDTSTSPDGDSITKRAWFYAFDSDNDGIFSDDTWYYHNGTSWVDSGTAYNNLFTFADTVNTGNLTDVTVETTHVGRYKFELKVYEEHDNRLLELVDTSYILTDDTADKPGEECIAEVDNIAPVTAVKVDVSKDEVYDVVVVTDYKDMDLITLQTELNLLKAEAFANNKKFNIHMITDQYKIGEQHKEVKYYTYARMIYLNYYLASGYYQSSTIYGGYTNITYNNDRRYHSIQYETTQGYTTPTVPFQKGDKVDWTRTTFSRSYENQEYGIGYNYSGVEFQFYNPDNKIATLTTRTETTNGSEQGMGFVQIWGNIKVVNESVSVSNSWTNTQQHVIHDKYLDIHSLDFSKVEDVPYTKDSKKIFIYFTKGTAFNYENLNGYNYSAGGIHKGLVDHLIYNDFETYVIAPDETTLDMKFDRNNHGSDIDSQYATLRELANCSTSRGKYILGDVSSDLWKSQISHLYKKNISLARKVEVENNVVTFTFDEPFSIGEKLDITLLQQQFNISDLVGNKITDPVITYEAKAEETNLKQLSSLIFKDPQATEMRKDIEVISIRNNGLIIYKDNKDGLLKADVSENMESKFTNSELEEIRNYDYTKVKDIKTFLNCIVFRLHNNTVKSFGRFYSNLTVNDSKWVNLKELKASNDMLVGVKNDNTILTCGARPGYPIDNHVDTSLRDQKYSFIRIVEGPSIYILWRALHGHYFTSIYGYGSNFYFEHFINKFHTTNFEVITNPTTYKFYYKLYGRYYQSYGYYEFKEITDLYGKNVKKLITSNNGYLAILQDNTIYIPQETRDELSRNINYPGIINSIYAIGKYKYHTYLNDKCILITGEHGELLIPFTSSRYETTSLGIKHIKIKDIKKIIQNPLYTSQTNMIIITKDGKRHDFTQSTNTRILPDSTKYYYSDSSGMAYITDSGYFNSSTIPILNSNSYYNYRRISGQFKKVVSSNSHNMHFVGITSYGNTAVYRRDGDANYLGSAQGRTDVADIQGLDPLFIFYNNGSIGFYKSSSYNYPDYGGLYSFKDKNIKKYLLAGRYLYGLDDKGTLWQTSSNGLIEVETNVQDIFRIYGQLTYLKEDGSLSQYGQGNKYETYEGMLETTHFITLKLKGSDKYLAIYNDKVTDHIGDFGNLYERVQYTNATQIYVGKHSHEGVAYKYKIFTDDINSVEDVLYHQDADDSWTTVTDQDIIPVQDGYYIGVVEVDSQNRIIRYSYSKARADNA